MTIVQNSFGGWSIAIYGRYVGNYATRADALRVARLNGYGDKRRDRKGAKKELNGATR